MTEDTEGRRKLIKAVGVGAAAVATQWTKPIVDAVDVPLHANASPPPPPRCVQTVSYSGPPAITLPNSSPATELAWVQTNISNTLHGLQKIEPGGTGWVASIAYEVVLIKAGREHYVFVNVPAGRSLTVPKGISHISRFVCD